MDFPTSLSVRKPTMPEREILLLRLAEFSKRIQVNRRLRDLGSMACAMFGLLALHEILSAVIAPAKVVAAMVPLLIVACVCVFALYGWRLMRRVPLDRAASEADVRADLKDELKSAYWFARHPSSTPIVELLLRRATLTAQRIDKRELFPLVFPPTLLAAMVIATVAVSLAWISPRFNYSTTPPSSEYAHRRDSAPERAHLIERSGLSATELQAARAVAQSPGNRHDIWARVEELTRSLDRSPDPDGNQPGVKGQNATNAMNPAEQLQRNGQAGRSALPDGEQMSAEVARGIMARLKALLNEEAPPAAGNDKAPADVSAQPTARVTRDQGGDSENQAADRGQGQHSVGETALNTLLRTISRSGTGSRQAVRGEGEGDERGRSNASAGAMGRRVGVSQAGAGGDNPATGNPAGDSLSDPVLGVRTTRLQSQLQRVNVRTSPGGDDGGTSESFYSETQSQDAMLGYQAVTGRQTASRETAGDAQEMPLTYRGAVKNYFLTGHSSEE